MFWLSVCTLWSSLSIDERACLSVPPLSLEAADSDCLATLSTRLLRALTSSASWLTWSLVARS